MQIQLQHHIDGITLSGVVTNVLFGNKLLFLRKLTGFADGISRTIFHVNRTNGTAAEGRRDATVTSCSINSTTNDSNKEPLPSQHPSSVK